MSLEEIDESEYGSELPKGFQKVGKKPEKLTKRKREENSGDEVVKDENKDGETGNEVKKDKKKKKKKKKKTKKDKQPKESTVNEEEGKEAVASK